MTTSGDAAPKRRRRYFAAAIVLAVAAAVAAVLLIGGDDDSDKSNAASPAPSGATVAGLRSVARRLGHPLYWVGKKSKYTYELTDTGERVYIRYLPPGIRVNDPRPNFLTIATYRYADPLARLRAYRRDKDATVRAIPGGGLAAVLGSRPRSVYVAYPGEGLLMEVFDPSPARARRLAFSGSVVPVR